MKKIIKLLALCLLITGVAVKLAFEQRGYIAFGGEWLIVPMILFLKYCFDYDKKEVA